MLAKFKFLRGTSLDPFGHTAERRGERALIGAYRDMIRQRLSKLTPANLATLVALASIPEEIRGYGHVKERHLVTASITQARLLQDFDGCGTPAPAITGVARAA